MHWIDECPCSDAGSSNRAGRQLAVIALEAMMKEGVEEVVLECETCNVAAQRLYQTLGFLRDKMLRRYYFTGTDAYRLKLRVK
jgi:N-alpha-acetyltransferase 30